VAGAVQNGHSISAGRVLAPSVPHKHCLRECNSHPRDHFMFLTGKALAKEKLDRIMEEVQGGKVLLTCKKHNYVGGKIPPNPDGPSRGCPECWKCYYWWDFATTPPHLRQERLDELEMVVHHAVEFAEKGKFGNDLELYKPGDPRFQVEIEKDVQ
jgi:hypothetical protein